MSEFEEAVRRASALPMTSATPKPRAGEQWLDEVVVVTGETPRTDALFRTNNEWLEFARQLERELAASTNDIKLWAANWEAMKAERDLLREREAELVNMLTWHVSHEGECLGDHPELLEAARALLAKHGR